MKRMIEPLRRGVCPTGAGGDKTAANIGAAQLREHGSVLHQYNQAFALSAAESDASEETRLVAWLKVSERLGGRFS